MSEFDDPRLSALYRQAPASEPERRSDALIVDAAHEAVRVTTRRRYAPWAVAATLVLGVGIGWRVLHLAPADESVVQEPLPAPVAEEPVPASTRETMPAPAGSGAAEADSDARMEAPFADMLGGAAKRVDTLKAADAPAAPAAETGGQGVSSFARRAFDTGVESERTAECRAFLPRAERDAEQWRTLIARARTAGDAAQLRCLEQHYRELFGDDGAVTRSAPDK